ncbi:MAG TPA: LD-carboxypeptidase [Bacillota bacterium]|nr:LD-carboxypeptidase [Bacillota bacterium]
MDIIRPQHLQRGDTIGIIAPSGPFHPKNLQKAMPFFHSIGLHTSFGKHLYESYGYLAGSDEERLHDFETMIADSDIKAIIFARGGYGVGRIVPYIDFEAIRNNPKIIWGYSDITYLHTAIRQQTGLVTFHGPMVASDIGKETFDDLSKGMFQQLFEPSDLIYNESISPLEVYANGEATGVLVGGNLSLLVSTIGTPYEIDTTDKLLLIEDVGEMPYEVDGMLQHLKQAGKMDDLNGLVIGDFSKATPDDLERSLTLKQVFHDYFHEQDFPVVGGFKIGHCMPHFSIPLGVKATLSAEKRMLTVEAGVI